MILFLLTIDRYVKIYRLDILYIFKGLKLNNESHERIRLITFEPTDGIFRCVTSFLRLNRRITLLMIELEEETVFNLR